MKQKVNPVMAIVAVVAVVLVAGLFIWRAGSGVTHTDADKPPGMPADAAQEFQKRMGSAAGPGGTTGPGPMATPSSGAPGGSGGFIPPTH